MVKEKVENKEQQADPIEVVQIIQKNWYWIWPILKNTYKYLAPKVKKFLTNKKKKHYERNLHKRAT